MTKYTAYFQGNPKRTEWSFLEMIATLNIYKSIPIKWNIR